MNSQYGFKGERIICFSSQIRHAFLRSLEIEFRGI